MTDKQTLEAFAKLLEPLAKFLNGIGDDYNGAKCWVAINPTI